MLITLLPLLLGLSAWGFSAAGLLLRRRELCLPSWILCGWTLFFPLLQTDIWVSIHDVSAILDVTHAFVLAASVLLGINSLLTLATFLRKKIS